ncbi:MAG: hypothetical protein RQ826_00230 [Xanthomonadales bacterium]|nr:hypothetical protein [Xanthomonadales bacterium]
MTLLIGLAIMMLGCSATAPALLYLLHPCSRMLATILTSAPHWSQVVMSMLKTRFNRFAQVIARDGMYAGFAGAKNRSVQPVFRQRFGQPHQLGELIPGGCLDRAKA